MKALERLVKRRVRRRDGSKITDREAQGLAKLAELNRDLWTWGEGR